LLLLLLREIERRVIKQGLSRGLETLLHPYLRALYFYFLILNKKNYTTPKSFKQPFNDLFLKLGKNNLKKEGVFWLVVLLV